ncbi:hypothetical protein [Paraburkholderia xenovorans]|uniref:hypothetical protein n=1 Tax=Paraburkholderia xenovorans TaxID=36873 RepID=UPI0038B8A66C
MNSKVRLIRAYTGTVVKLLSVGVAGGAIFVVGTSNGKRIRIRADWYVLASIPALGETWSVKGSLEASAYGTQLVATLAQVEKPRGQNIVQFLGYGPTFSDQGPRSAQILFNRMRSSLQDALEHRDITLLVERGKLSLSVATRLITEWHDFWNDVVLRDICRRAALPLRLSSIATRFWGSQTHECLSSNPYILVSLCPWSTIDNAALRHFACEEDADVRLLGAVDATCWETQSRGHTATPLTDLSAGVAQKIGIRFANQAIALALRTKRLVLLKSFDGTQLAQAVGIFRIESEIRRFICPPPSLLQRQPSNHLASKSKGRYRDSSNARKSVVTLLDATAWNATDIIARYDRRNDDALHIIYGCGISKVENKNCIQLSEVTSDFSTIELKAQVIVIHSADGIDIPMFGKLLRRIPNSAQICLVRRLPYQSHFRTGSMMSALASTPWVDTVDLGPPPSISQKILRRGLKCIADGTPPYSISRGLRLEPAHPFHAIECHSWKSILEHAISSYYELSASGEVVIVLGRRDLRQQVSSILHKEAAISLSVDAKSALTASLAYGEVAVEGEPIVCNRSLTDLGVPRGSIGRLSKIYERPVHHRRFGRHAPVIASAEFNVGGTVELNPEELNSLSLGYALPVERMQFCSPDHVIVPIAPCRTFDRYWIHSAVASSLRDVMFIGDLNVLRTSISRVVARTTSMSGLAAELIDSSKEKYSG